MSIIPPEDREQRILRQAQERPPEQRAAFLDQACGDAAESTKKPEALPAPATNAPAGGGAKK